MRRYFLDLERQNRICEPRALFWSSTTYLITPYLSFLSLLEVKLTYDPVFASLKDIMTRLFISLYFDSF